VNRHGWARFGFGGYDAQGRVFVNHGARKENIEAG
jgi:hypothetical protein